MRETREELTEQPVIITNLQLSISDQLALLAGDFFPLPLPFAFAFSRSFPLPRRRLGFRLSGGLGSGLRRCLCLGRGLGCSGGYSLLLRRRGGRVGFRFFRRADFDHGLCS